MLLFSYAALQHRPDAGLFGALMVQASKRLEDLTHTRLYT
jgi:hypothetical protein